MESNLERWRKSTDHLRAELAAARAKIRGEKAALHSLRARREALEQATHIAQSVAAQVQSKAHQKIAEIVTQCLAIFDEPYTFHIKIERKRGKTEARLLFERNGLECDPLTASGGGVVDVASFALRVAALCLSRPSLRKLLVLDEPLKHLSADYRPRMAQMMETLSDKLGLQIILVTHDESLQVGKVVELT